MEDGICGRLPVSIATRRQGVADVAALWALPLQPKLMDELAPFHNKPTASDEQPPHLTCATALTNELEETSLARSFPIDAEPRSERSGIPPPPHSPLSRVSAFFCPRI